MRELSYVLRFERDPDATAPAAVASGLVRTSALESQGATIETTRRQLAGRVSYESSYTLREDGVRFTENGTVTVGPDGDTLAFSTLGFGYLLPEDPDTNMNPGAVMWTIDSGTGFFAGATGLITSNFRVNQQNRSVDR